MTPRKAGIRHPLLIYRRAMDRIWPAALALGLLLGAIWAWEFWSGQPLLAGQADLWLLGGGAACLGFAAFAWLARGMAYVQPRHDYLRLTTPFLSLRISYRRVRSVHPASFSQLFPPNDSGWAERRFLEPFYGMTAVVVELNSLPLSRGLLRLFLAPQMLSPRANGLVLLTPDWMSFSTELDAFMGGWLNTQARQRPPPGSSRV
jgi:hypothetical protein